MELPRRTSDDMYLPDGEFRERVHSLRQFTHTHELAIGIVYAFDYRTRMLPFWYADKRMVPCSVRLLGDALHDAGFRNLRIVLQQWSPNVLPSRMRLNGRPLDILLVSSMQVHVEPAYALVRDAHRMGDTRPLILAGGPKAIYEPTDFFELGPEPGIGADCVVTGEAFVLLDLLYTILADRRDFLTARDAFENARLGGRLKSVPGLVYPSPDAHACEPIAINTGVQRLIRDLDELPLADAGYRMIEPPHRRRILAVRPCGSKRVGKLSPIAAVIATQGCRFNCPYCPIPAVNQRTWRHKSPQRFVAELKHIYENFGIRAFFGTDDNFFNDRETVVTLMSELGRTTTGGIPLGKRIRFYTEATQADVFKSRDLLPMCRKAGLRGLWFGIEDLTGRLVKKGQNADHTEQLFAAMHKLGIQPHAMMIHSDTQPLRSAPGDLSGLLNQVRYVFEQGAVSYQCTYLGPAIGTRNLEPALASRTVFQRVGGRPVPNAFQDGNHVVASRHPRPWQQQLNLLRAYITFYNPINTVRTLCRIRKDSVSPKHLMHQLIGQIGLLLTIPRMLAWAWRLKHGSVEVYDGLAAARIPMIDAASGNEINWAIEHVPSLGVQRATPLRARSKSHRTYGSNLPEAANAESNAPLRLYLINPRNPLVSLTHVRESRWNRYRVWKPLGLLALAALTPPEWEITVFDENVRMPDYAALARPDLVGVTAFTSQANRAYEVAALFRGRGVPVVMGGIHATMCTVEATSYVDSVVTGEAERVWVKVLADARQGALRPLYQGAHAEMDQVPPARHDLLIGDYACGSIQTTRGCPLNCSFCSVTAFNGYRYRQRPVADVVREFGTIREKIVLIVDDNLIGTSRKHLARAKDLFRAMIQAKLRKRWIAQVTINMADDDELLALAAQAGCAGVFIGFESPTVAGLKEVGKKFNLVNGRDFAVSVRRIQRHRILVVGSFIMGLDTDEPGIGRRIVEAAEHYGVDVLNTLFLTPLPGTRLWSEFEAQGRIAADRFPEDWRHYTLTFPVARYRHFSGVDIAAEMETCDHTFYSLRNALRRAWGSFWHRRQPLIALVANLSYRSNLRQSSKNYRVFLDMQRHRVAADHHRVEPRSEPPRVPCAIGATSQSGMADV